MKEFDSPDMNQLLTKKVYGDDGVNDDEEIENGSQTASLISVFQDSKRYRAAKSKPLATRLFTANHLFFFFFFFYFHYFSV